MNWYLNIQPIPELTKKLFGKVFGHAENAKNGETVEEQLLEKCIIPKRELTVNGLPEITEKHNDFNVIVTDAADGVKY